MKLRVNVPKAVAVALLTDESRLCLMAVGSTDSDTVNVLLAPGSKVNAPTLVLKPAPWMVGMLVPL